MNLEISQVKTAQESLEQITDSPNDTTTHKRCSGATKEIC